MVASLSILLDLLRILPFNGNLDLSIFPIYDGHSFIICVRHVASYWIKCITAPLPSLASRRLPSLICFCNSWQLCNYVRPFSAPLRFEHD